MQKAEFELLEQFIDLKLKRNHAAASIALFETEANQAKVMEMLLPLEVALETMRNLIIKS